MCGHVVNHIRHEEEKNIKINTALSYDTREDEYLIYCPLYANNLKDNTNTISPRGLSTEAFAEDKLWFFYCTKHIGIKVNKAEY